MSACLRSSCEKKIEKIPNGVFIQMVDRTIQSIFIARLIASQFALGPKYHEYFKRGERQWRIFNPSEQLAEVKQTGLWLSTFHFSALTSYACHASPEPRHTTSLVYVVSRFHQFRLIAYVAGNSLNIIPISSIIICRTGLFQIIQLFTPSSFAPLIRPSNSHKLPFYVPVCW